MRTVRVEDSELRGIEASAASWPTCSALPVRISLTVVCIITSAVASAVGSIFMQQIVDNVVFQAWRRLRRGARHPGAPRLSRWACLQRRRYR